MMGCFSAAFVCVSWLITPLMGSTGYIVANIVNMMCRCVHHAICLKRAGLDSICNKIRPDRRWLFCTLLTSGLLLLSEQRSLPYTPKSLCCHLLLGVASGLGLLGLLWVFDKDSVKQCSTLFKKKVE